MFKNNLKQSKLFQLSAIMFIYLAATFLFAGISMKIYPNFNRDLIAVSFVAILISSITIILYKYSNIFTPDKLSRMVTGNPKYFSDKKEVKYLQIVLYGLLGAISIFLLMVLLTYVIPYIALFLAMFLRVFGIDLLQVSYDFSSNNATTEMILQWRDGTAGKLFVYSFVLFFAPFFEEIIFRGFIGDIFKIHSPGKHIKMILVSACLFALLHLDYSGLYKDFHTFLSVGTSGALLGILYTQTKDIRVSIVAHIVYNGFLLIFK